MVNLKYNDALNWYVVKVEIQPIFSVVKAVAPGLLPLENLEYSIVSG